MTFRIEVVSEPSRFAALEKQWQTLWARSKGFIFQSHEWISAWLTGMCDRRDFKLQVLLTWDGEQLCGAMPCAIHRRSGLRVLNWTAQLFSDYCDCLLEPTLSASVILSLMWDGMMQIGGFDLISLQQVRPDALCRGFLDLQAASGKRLQIGEHLERCMRIENNWLDGEAFFKSLSKKSRNNYTRGKRILSEFGGPIRFRIIDSQQDVVVFLDEIMRLKTIWLQTNDPKSPLLGQDRLVLRSVLLRAYQAGFAKIFLLECGEFIAAASVNFVCNGRMEAYFTAYDSVFERASPGTILIVDYTRWSFDRGLRVVDFLRGEEAFKFRMANAETLLSGFSGAQTLVGQIAKSSHRWLVRRRQRLEVAQPAHSQELAHAK